MSHVSPALDSNYTPHLRRRDKFGFLVNQGLCQASDETKKNAGPLRIYFWTSSLSLVCQCQRELRHVVDC